MLPDKSLLYLSDNRGVYIPQHFAEETFPECISGASQSDLEILKSGPEHEWYWDAWENVMRDAIITDPKTGQRYTIYQNGDCWLIPEGAEFTDE